MFVKVLPIRLYNLLTFVFYVPCIFNMLLALNVNIAQCQINFVYQLLKNNYCHLKFSLVKYMLYIIFSFFHGCN